MTIPHIAIISGLLLACNNPNTFEGIVGKANAEPETPKWGFLSWAYDSRYHPAWIWDRGRSKKIWALRCCHQGSRSPEGFHKAINMGIGGWATIVGFAALLIVVPSFLACLTAYHTPKVGMSCRSFTFLLYMLCQLWLIVLWIWNIESTSLDEYGAPDMPVTRSVWTRRYNSANWQAYIWYAQISIACGISLFTSIGGTLMQIIGVFRNCLCAIPVTSWGRSRDATEFVISTNSAESIHNASTIWKGTNAAAIAFLCLMSLVGWWSQKRLRYQFKMLISHVDDTAQTSRRERRIQNRRSPRNRPNRPTSSSFQPLNSIDLEEFNFNLDG